MRVIKLLVLSITIFANTAFAQENNVKEWETKVGDFFMDGYASIRLKPEKIPNILYNPTELDFTDTSRWGLLQLNLLALESIAEDGRIIDTYLRYLPRANLNVSAPPLYNNTSGQSFDPAAVLSNYVPVLLQS